MHGVMKNIAHLCSRTRSHMWDTEGWKKVVVCIVADGRKKCDPGVLDVLETMGVYQKGVAKNMVNEKPVKAHLYEVIDKTYCEKLSPCLLSFLFIFIN